ncbi:hypothetical protein CALCODRAFT_501543 [Calocera cornea HHB12733]|uniref:Ricin B lectin domain-containing protein n=1 Tax=Calocera cornea HHB12733 TaxID=1353952 RepID=A0A165DKW5_9BASI|nr:hypothetical protein CALCODRAFT_501543 [Calocera cornea HHB12733]
MLAAAILFVSLSLAATVYAAPQIVGVISCSSLPDAVGELDYSTSAIAPLGGYRTTTTAGSEEGGYPELTVDVENPACSLVEGQLFGFYTCTSTFMNYTQTETIKYGVIQDVASGQCLYEYENNLTLQDCYISDDSGQVLQFFALGGPVSASTLTLVRQRWDGVNLLGLDLVPTAPPSPLADFPVTLTSPSATISNILYLESGTACL